MAKSPQLKSRISAIAKELANGKERAEIVAKYGKKWQLSARSIDRLIEKAKEQADSLRNLAEKTANDTLVEETKEAVKEAVKQGLKTKIERLLILQKEVDNCLTDLQNPKLDTYEKVALRKIIKDLQSEISKIEGDYEKDNKQKKPEVNVTNLPDIPTEQLLEYLSNRNGR